MYDFKFKEFITELYVNGVRDNDKDKENYLVVVYDTIYLFNIDMDCEIISNLIRMIYKRFNIKYDTLENKLLALCKNKSPKKIKFLLTNLLDYHDDFIIGILKNDDFYLYKSSYTPEPTSSNIIYKLTKQLKIKNIYYINLTQSRTFKDVKFSSSDIKNKIPDIAYHGTTSFYLENILRIGIRPDLSSSNYNLVQHKNLIFFTTSKDEAIVYATNATHNNNGVPIIIQFKIPDKDLIIADYDVERFSGIDKHYKHLNKINTFKARTYKVNVDPDKLSREYSLFGYKGVINPQHFISILLYNKTTDDDDYMEDYGTIRDFSKFTKKEVIDLLNNKEFDKYVGFVDLNY
jgi:hypothetical protein